MTTLSFLVPTIASAQAATAQPGIKTLVLRVNEFVLNPLIKLGFVVALCRLSPNLLLSRIGGIYVEIVRNLPLLFQILFWYLAVLAALPALKAKLAAGAGRNL